MIARQFADCTPQVREIIPGGNATVTLDVFGRTFVGHVTEGGQFLRIGGPAVSAPFEVVGTVTATVTDDDVTLVAETCHHHVCAHLHGNLDQPRRCAVVADSDVAPKRRYDETGTWRQPTPHEHLRDVRDHYARIIAVYAVGGLTMPADLVLVYREVRARLRQAERELWP
jgi:hypothetical protein